MEGVDGFSYVDVRMGEVAFMAFGLDLLDSADCVVCFGWLHCLHQFD